MQFILIIQICSAALGICQEKQTNPKLFDSFYSCVTTGFSVANDITHNMGELFVNDNKILINFMCEQANHVQK